ncbi:hypothetical protein CDAR_515091 [Caerostris darwini]|uniref:Uncharacterized protein n=1 Tax=Caerostris darwini TaxID=1538125 RepID=A0AAV4VY84_9ARAC|nr:hypothetical protein CDAR_515091 [Caerostris darwini]
MASNVSEESSLIMCDSRNMEEKEILVDNLRAVNITLPDSASSICTQGLARSERIYEELEPGVSVEELIVSTGETMGLEVEERRERAHRGVHPGTDD